MGDVAESKAINNALGPHGNAAVYAPRPRSATRSAPSAPSSPS
ncbi:putative beta-ketoacyl-acyl carrier protein synthase B kasB [Mycobacterium avium subsp. avium 2285 (R)]|nr:putative beta-ketoacyl-acyl carrier protein synthase B kasB [Mycobacterium avium subsp. avium 2285 (R)]